VKAGIHQVTRLRAIRCAALRRAILGAATIALVLIGSGSIRADAPNIYSWAMEFGEPQRGWLEGRVDAVVAFKGNLILGGDFHGEGYGGSFEDLAHFDGEYLAPLRDDLYPIDPQGWISCLMVHDDRLYIGGRFRLFDGHSVHNILVYVGSGDDGKGGFFLTIGGGLEPAVTALGMYQDEIVAAQGASHVDADPAILRVWKGNHWQGLPYPAGVVSADIRTLVEHGGQLWAGGALYSDGENAVEGRGVACWDGAQWSWPGDGLRNAQLPENELFPSGIPGVNDLLVHDGEIYAAGSTHNPATGIRGLARFDGADWQPLPTSGAFTSMVDSDDGIIPLGTFEHDLPGGESTPRLSVWTDQGWQVFDQGNGGPRPALVAQYGDFVDGLLHVASDPFLNEYRPYAPKLSAFDGLQWIDPLGSRGLSGPVHAILREGYNAVVAGDFHRAGDFLSPYIAYFDDWRFYPMSAGIAELECGPTIVDGLIKFEGEYYASGAFALEGLGAQGIARWDGSRWQPLGLGLERTTGQLRPVVYSMVVFDDKLAVAGLFDRAGGLPVGAIAMWDGTNWEAFPADFGDPLQPPPGGPDPVVYALTVHDGQLVAGGSLVSSGGNPMPALAYWDGSQWLPGLSDDTTNIRELVSFKGQLLAMRESVSPDAVELATVHGGTAQSLLPLGDHWYKDYFADAFKTHDYVLLATSKGLLSYDGSVLTTHVTDPVRSVAVNPYRALVGGDFTSIDGRPSMHFASGRIDTVVPAASVNLELHTSESGLEFSCDLGAWNSVSDLILERRSERSFWTERERIAGPFDQSRHILTDASAEDGDWVYRAVALLNGARITSNELEVAVAPSTKTAVLAAYPNPFNATTTIEFSLARAGDVVVSVSSVNGRRVARHELSDLSVGIHEWSWHGLDQAGQPVASGTYFLRLDTPDGPIRSRVNLVK